MPASGWIRESPRLLRNARVFNCPTACRRYFQGFAVKDS